MTLLWIYLDHSKSWWRVPMNKEFYMKSPPYFIYSPPSCFRCQNHIIKGHGIDIKNYGYNILCDQCYTLYLVKPNIYKFLVNREIRIR